MVCEMFVRQIFRDYAVEESKSPGVKAAGIRKGDKGMDGGGRGAGKSVKYIITADRG